MSKKKIVVGVTGASGSIYAKVLLDQLAPIPNIEVALVMTGNAKDVWQHELGHPHYLDLPLRTYSLNDYQAPFASGSSSFEALVICPCSMGTLGRIANGISDNLITRCADVMLKERRKLICVVRDTPYNLIHIQNMEKVSLAGGIICPASPSFYSKPQTLEEMAATVTDRVLSLLDIPNNRYRWNEEE